jgi:hypothetical protein
MTYKEILPPHHSLPRKGMRRVHSVALKHAENVNIVSCGNALGKPFHQ